MTYYWVNCTAHGKIPDSAVRGGTDADGSPIYVGRAMHANDWLPAKVIPSKKVAYVPYGGQEHAKQTFEVLCEQKFQWVHSSGGSVPHNAVACGKTVDGEILYVGRARHGGALTVGKIHPSHRCLYIPFGGREIRIDNYETLCLM